MNFINTIYNYKISACIVKNYLRTSSEMDELSDWMLTFKGKLDDTTSAKVFQTLKANGFRTRLQLKLLTREQIDVMFQTEISLGAKSLLLYKLGVLCENSPLQPIANTRKIIKKNEEESSQPQARKVSN